MVVTPVISTDNGSGVGAMRRESYEKTLNDEKTRPGSITGGGGGVGRAEAHRDSAMDLQSLKESFFSLKLNFGKAELLK